MANHVRFLTGWCTAFVLLLAAATEAAPPRITSIDPPPALNGLWIVDQSGLAEVVIEFDQPVIVPVGAVFAWSLKDGLLADASIVQETLESVRITFASPIRQDRITIVIEHSITNFEGKHLDGQIANPQFPALPSGNGTPGGHAVFRYNVLQGDVNRDGIVDGDDMAALLAALGTCAGEPGYSALADLNGDGCINVLDVNILMSAMGGMLPPIGDLAHLRRHSSVD